jgi:hypothetical protein
MSGVLRILNLRFLRVPLVEVFEILPRNCFHGLKMVFIVFRRYDVVEKNVARFILG